MVKSIDSAAVLEYESLYVNFSRMKEKSETILYHSDANGNITPYQVYSADGLPVMRIDITGKPYGGTLTQNVQRSCSNTRYASERYTRCRRELPTRLEGASTATSVHFDNR